MQVAEEYSHRHGLEALQQKGLHDEVRTLVCTPEIGMARGNAKEIKATVSALLSNAGWAINARVSSRYKLTINGMKSRVGFTMQTGNIARAIYDLVKFEAMHKSDRIDASVLVVPTSGAARALGSNIASSARVTNELDLFRHIITVPCLVLGIDET